MKRPPASILPSSGPLVSSLAAAAQAVASRRGRNEFHSDLYCFGRSDAPDACNFFQHKTDASRKCAPEAYALNDGTFTSARTSAAADPAYSIAEISP